MTDKNHHSLKKLSNPGVKFPCGNLEKILKAFRQFGDGKIDEFSCSEIIKKYNKCLGDASGYEAIIQNLCSGKEESIDCIAVIKELFGNLKKKDE
ncbi:MAG: hypothetical protein A2277_02905 [Desulfobacterales bacterium RIFOXYA12_FULL_46_15]|nr:MAG: hypothetical protein A2277_02905 [Desulfobacterales bacterium RIFOXYA12_FULL_46_15]